MSMYEGCNIIQIDGRETQNHLHIWEEKNHYEEIRRQIKIVLAN